MTIKGLDRWLTTEPPDDATPWFERCADLINPWSEEHDKQIDKWMERLYEKNYTPEYAAKIISKLLINFYV